MKAVRSLRERLERMISRHGVPVVWLRANPVAAAVERDDGARADNEAFVRPHAFPFLGHDLLGLRHLLVGEAGEMADAGHRVETRTH